MHCLFSNAVKHSRGYHVKEEWQFKYIINLKIKAPLEFLEKWTMSLFSKSYEHTETNVRVLTGIPGGK